VPIEVSMTIRLNVCTVYFDGWCPLCRREISYYQRQTGGEAIRFVDVSQPDTQLGPGLERAHSLARFHARDANGRLVSGAQAFVMLWRELPRFAWLSHLARVPGALALLEGAYRGFLVVRPLLQRLLGDRANAGVALAKAQRSPARESRCSKDVS
jgi:predicted DCC family thiol-disulfide oxidoreductase YuxK